MEHHGHPVLEVRPEEGVRVSGQRHQILPLYPVSTERQGYLNIFRYYK